MAKRKWSLGRKYCQTLPEQERTCGLSFAVVQTDRVSGMWADSQHVLPLLQRVQPAVTLSRNRDALLRQPSPDRPVVYPPLMPEVVTLCSRCSFFLRTPACRMLSKLALFVQMRCAFPEICGSHRGPGSLLLIPRLDAQTTFAKLSLTSVARMMCAPLTSLPCWRFARPRRQRSLPSTSKPCGRTCVLKRSLMLLALLPTPALSCSAPPIFGAR